MKNIKIEDEEAFNEIFSSINLFDVFEGVIKINYEKMKIPMLILIMIIIFKFIVDLFCKENISNLKQFKKYIHDCKNLIKYQRNKTDNIYPYISVCIPVLNMENYIEKNLISILNQSFQDFHIIIVDDASNDKTTKIIRKIQYDDKRIKLISHQKTLGVYRSRIESILNSKSKYIILMDPDDIYINEYLFQNLYIYNKNKNLDIIEFSVMRQIEGKNKIYLPDNDFETHYHKFNRDIIYQPELSNILYYIPKTKEYSHTICRNIWNKMIRKNIFIQSSNYIGNNYYNKYIITSDDIILNIILYQFSNNYSNINLPGYLYIKRKVSMSRGGGKKLKQLRAKNYFEYFGLFYKYIKDFNKDINILFYEMMNLERFILKIKETNMTKYIKSQLILMEKIINENILSDDFENYLKNLSFYFKK